VDATTTTSGTAIEVTRPRWVFVGAAVSYRVYIDGVKVGSAGRGKPARFPVAPGPHTVRVKAGWGSGSNELELNVVPEAVRSLVCTSDPATWSVIGGGLYKLPQQIGLLRKSLKHGRSSVKSLLLTENSNPQGHP